MLNTIKLTEEQLFDYMYCPAYFEMKNVKQLDIPDKVTIPRLLNEVAKYFYFKIYTGEVPMPNELKKKWDDICMNNQEFITPKKNIQGIGLIMNLFNWAAYEKMIVLDMSTPYKITVKNVELTGCIDTLISAPNNNYEILVTNFSNRLQDQQQVDSSLKYSLASYAFRNVFNKEELGIKVHSVKYNKDILSQRTNNDYDKLETTIYNIGNGIIHNIFYPREGIGCNNCTARQYCQYWFI